MTKSVKRLIAKQVEYQARKYNKGDKRGKYSKLKSKLGKGNADRIIAKAKKMIAKKSPSAKPSTQKKKASSSSKTITFTPKIIPFSAENWDLDKANKIKGVKIKTQKESGDEWGFLPEYGKQKCFDSFPVVVNIAGKRWEIAFTPEIILGDHPFIDDDKWNKSKRKITFTPTKKALSKTSTSTKRNPFIAMFGQHNSVQNKGHLFPVDAKGKITPHLMTVESNWGDYGNEVYFLGLDSKNNPSLLFFEASCC